VDDEIGILRPYPPALDSIGVVARRRQAPDDEDVVADLGR